MQDQEAELLPNRGEGCKTKGKIIDIAKAAVKADPLAPPRRGVRITSQDTVLIAAVHEREGIIETFPEFFTKSYLLRENNYQTETEVVERSLMNKFRSILNSIGGNAEISFTIHNREINQNEFRERVLLKETGDGLDHLRREMNLIIYDRMKEGLNGIGKKKYLTVGVHAEDIRKAEEEFLRLDTELSQRFLSLGSGAEPIPIEERLEIMHDIYHPDQTGEFLTRIREMKEDGRLSYRTSFDFANMRSQGLTISDLIAPESFQTTRSYLRIGRKYVRVMEVRHLPSVLSDDFFVSKRIINHTLPLNVKTLHTIAMEGFIYEIK